jgi:hypothetical protein
MAHHLPLPSITEKKVSQELRGTHGKPRFFYKREVARICHLLESLPLHYEYARDSRNIALVLSPSLGLQEEFSLHVLQTLSESAHALSPSKIGKVRFLPSMTCRNNLCEPTRNGFGRDEKATRGATGP